MFRPKTSIPVSYEQQGYIYFISKKYKALPRDKRQRIDMLCARAGGEHRQALLKYVTTDVSVTKICMDYYISSDTLHRCVREYYRIFPELL